MHTCQLKTASGLNPKQGNDAIITVRGGRFYHHQDTPDINCPICIAAVQPQGEPFEFKASLVDPSKASTTESTRRKQPAARHHRDMTSKEIPVSDVRNDCECKLSVGNMFAFAIFTVIIGPKPLIRLHGHEPCRFRGSVNHDSDQCQTCLTSYSRNLRLVRVAVSSLPFAIAVACLVIQQHAESARIADGEGQPQDCTLIEIAFIAGNSSLEPLIEGVCAHIYIYIHIYTYIYIYV